MTHLIAGLERAADDLPKPIEAWLLREAAAALRELEAERDALRALLREARGHLQYGTQPSELFLRIDAALKEKP